MQSLGNWGTVSHSWFWCNTCPINPSAPKCLWTRAHGFLFLSSLFSLPAPWTEVIWRVLLSVSAPFIKAPALVYRANTDGTNQQTGSIWGGSTSTAAVFIHWLSATKPSPTPRPCHLHIWVWWWAACFCPSNSPHHKDIQAARPKWCFYFISLCIPQFWKLNPQTSSIFQGRSIVLAQHFLHWEF